MKKIKIFFGIILSLVIIFFFLDFLFPLDKDKLYRPLSTQIYDKNNILLRMNLSTDGFWRLDANNTEIPPLIKKTVLLFEDKWFYYHFGINPLSLAKAFFHNITNKNNIGASTISMQVARMMQRRPRSYTNKLIEIFNALQLELHYKKDEILTFYFNLAPYGGNIEGIKTAGYFYFKQSLDNLSIAQIATLTTIPKNPNMNRLDKQKNLKEKRERILKLMLKEKLINKSAFLRANIEEISQKRSISPINAPHYTNLALNSKANTIKTGLDYNLQRFVEKTLKASVQKLKHLNVNNASAIIIDNENMEVLAYVGSDNFYKKEGQNDGVLMLRSPGSTLKPFIYAKALDLGLITPKRELFDIPLNMGSYEPKNFNKLFMGSVKASEALQFSLNIPVVELNTILEEDSLYEMLKLANISSIDKSKEYYSQGIVLGGFGISLLDLTHLYTSFSNNGKLLPLKVANKIIDKNTTLMSPESAWIISEILADGIRPEFSEFWQSAIWIPKIGFKTGTSANSKDLYTIGYSKEYTIGVWLGNFDGKKTKNLSGIQTASKIVFNIFKELNIQSPISWLEKPKNIQEEYICTDSILTNNCKYENFDYIIKGVETKRHCKLLRAEVLRFLFLENRINSISDLAFNPCYLEWKEIKPIIVSPHDNAILVTDKTIKDKRKIMVKCHSFNEDENIYLKINSLPLFEAKSGKEYFFSLDNGYQEITCMDSFSKSTTNKFLIKEE